MRFVALLGTRPEFSKGDPQDWETIVRRCIKLDSSVAGVGWQKNHPGAKNGAETLIFLHFWWFFEKFVIKNAIKGWYLQWRGGRKMTIILLILFGGEGRKFTKFQFYTPAIRRYIWYLESFTSSENSLPKAEKKIKILIILAKKSSQCHS